jgi:hypothetical protein
LTPPIGTHVREALQSIIILIGVATHKIMDGRERREAEKSWRSREDGRTRKKRSGKRAGDTGGEIK